MKFGRYLRDSLIPEWRKAYIDYRGLKKLIKKMAEHEPGKPVDRDPSPPGYGLGPGVAGPSRSQERYPGVPVERHSERLENEAVSPSPMSPLSSGSPDPPKSPTGGSGDRTPRAPVQADRERRESATTDEGTLRDFGEAGRTEPRKTSGDATRHSSSSEEENLKPQSKGQLKSPTSSPSSQNSPPGPSNLPGSTSNNGGGGLLPSSRSGKSVFKGVGIGRGKARSSRSGRTPIQPATLGELLATLTPVERAFFDKLDQELDKVSTFYNARETEARERAAVLMEQLKELQEHREAYHAAYPKTPAPWPWRPGQIREAINKHAPPPPAVHLPHLPDAVKFWSSSHDADAALKERTEQEEREEREREREERQMDPHGYYQAKKRIKKALQEYYRGVELLDNYRILNLTGFRKALKKFEKTTGTLFAQELYMNERVEPLPLARSELLHALRTQMEVVYADRFVSGDRKRARDRLRAETIVRTHHFSTFRAGLYMGLGIPAIVLGTIRSFDPAVRAALPEWDSLLNIYGVLFILPVFTFLLGLNLTAWTRARINWVFIFDLDVRSAQDYRQFFELPAFLFMTLAYCFFFSYTLVDNPHVAPHTWPLAWVVLAILTLINPLPIARRRSRYWFLYMAARLMVSGATRVEFADFWLGDQLCSMAYTLGNLYVFGCAYNNDWNGVSALCGTANTWVAVFLSALPYVLRFSQCVRRWADSGLKIHLLNAGKYLSMIVVYITYYHWRHLGSGRDTSFVLYVLFASIGAIYTCSWDLLMDWSLMRPKAPWPFLREDLIYGKEAVWAYYFAIVSNIILRFDWVCYIPVGGLSLTVRAWIFACLEALRRFQWNFYRVENEHIGNADRYRVTKEIPLPYTVRPGDDGDGDVDDSDQEGGPGSIKSVLSRRSGRGKKKELARSSSYRGRVGLEDGLRERDASRVVEEDL